MKGGVDNWSDMQRDCSSSPCIGPRWGKDYGIVLCRKCGSEVM
jgi:hypothetical protein